MPPEFLSEQPLTHNHNTACQGKWKSQIEPAKKTTRLHRYFKHTKQVKNSHKDPSPQSGTLVRLKTALAVKITTLEASTRPVTKRGTRTFVYQERHAVPLLTQMRTPQQPCPEVSAIFTSGGSTSIHITKGLQPYMFLSFP